jgi:hypothetical protein
MTHFVGIVVAENAQELEAILEPYSKEKQVHEYFVELSSDDIERMAEFYTLEQSDFDGLIKRMDDWMGGPGLVQNNKLGYMKTYNPDSKWDWYVPGGKWKGIIPNNQCKVVEVESYFKEYLESLGYEFYMPSILVTEQGWFESKDWVCWGLYSNIEEGKEKMQTLMSELKDKNCYLVDFHI